MSFITLQTIISHLDYTSRNDLFQSQDYPKNMTARVLKLDAARDPLYYQGQIIKKLRLFQPYEFLFREGASFAALQINCEKKKYICSIPHNLDENLVGKIFDYLIAHHAACELAYMRPAISAYPLSIWDTMAPYTEIIIKTYEEIHHAIANIFESVILEIKSNAVQIVEIGCAEGKALKLCHKIAERNHIRVKSIGFDLSIVNIEKAKTDSDSSIEFYKGNSLDIEFLLAPHISRDSPTIVIASGALNRCVLKNGFDALQVLQGLYRAGVSKIICSGTTEILFTSHLAKRAGFKIINYYSKDAELNVSTFQTPKQLYILQRIALDETVVKLHRGDTYLDLQSCSRPLDVLKRISREVKDKITEVDISFCPIYENEYSDLKEILGEFKNLIRITYCSSNQEMMQNLLAKFATSLPILGFKEIDDRSVLYSPRLLNQLFRTED